MPVSVRRSPFTQQPEVVEPQTERVSLKVPQVRVLAALMPDEATEPLLSTRAVLAEAMGYTPTSGTVTRALCGGRNTARAPRFPGVVECGLVEEVVLDIEGVSETNYRITELGMRVYSDYLATNGKLPPVKSVEKCTNDRYRRTPREK